MGFHHREMKFYVTVLHLDIHTKTTKLLHKKLLDQKIYTLFQNDGHIRPTWPLFGLSRDEVPGKGRPSRYRDKD